MDISLDLYKVFSAVAEAGSISDAARLLYITQPAVSQSVRRLEHELGVKLFERGTKGVALTREGELLRGYVSSAMGMLEAGESRMRMLSKLDAGELRRDRHGGLCALPRERAVGVAQGGRGLGR